MVRLVSALKDDNDELATQTAEYIFHLHDTKPSKIKNPVSPEQLLEQIQPDALFMTLKIFEGISKSHRKANLKLYESARGNSRPGTKWSLTFMQSLVNCQCR